MIKNLKFFVVFLVFLFGMNFLFSAETKKYADGEILIKFKAGSALSSKSSLKKSSTGEIDVDSFFEKNKTKYKISEHNKIFNNLDNSTNLTKSSMSKRKNVNTSEVEEIKDSLNKIYKIKFSTDSDAKEIAEEIAKNDEIEWAEPNYIFHKSDVTPNDTYVNYQWHLYGDWSGDSKGTSNKNINAKTAWDISEGSSDIIVAVIDDGLAITHDDIKDNVWINSGEIANNGIDDDGNGYIDDVNGWNFVLGTNSIEPIKYNDTNQGWMYEDHGTHVSGIIGAKGNNNLGVAGINWNSKIMLLKLFNGNNGGGLDILIQAITYAVNNGASVINMSLGADSGSTALQTAINYAYTNGVVTVAAAGNGTFKTNYIGTENINYPANYSNVIAVASTDYQDKKSSFSNYGTNIDISAPGSSIYSLNDWHNSNPPYKYMSGTSMATPVVTGVVSLLLSVNPTLTPAEIINIIKTTADSIDSLNASYTGKLGAGRINAGAALKSISYPALKYVYNSLSGNISIQNSTSTISAKWEFYNNATKYYYQITKDSSLTVLTSSKTTTQTSITEEMELENETTYYIYVQGENAEGAKSKVYRTNGVYVKSNIGRYGEETEMLYNSGVKINIPANTFSEDYKIEVEEKGTSETIISQANNKIENSTYRSYAQISGKYYEFKARKKSDGTEIKNFDKGITIKIPYIDADGNGIIDGTSVKVKGLKIYYLNENSVEWEKVKNVWYDTTNNTVNFMTDHFSIYGLLEADEESSELDKVIIYPNPCKIKKEQYVKIGDLPTEIEDLKIEIYDISGKLLKKLDKNNVEREVSGNKIYWNGMSNKNERLASGIYIARISSQGSHKTFKIAILN